MCRGRCLRVWIERVGGEPPMAFENLLDRLLPEGALRDAIDRLLVVKRRSAEVEDGPQIPLISGFLDAQLMRMEVAPLQRQVVATTKHI